MKSRRAQIIIGLCSYPFDLYAIASESFPLHRLPFSLILLLPCLSCLAPLPSHCSSHYSVGDRFIVPSLCLFVRWIYHYQSFCVTLRDCNRLASLNVNILGGLNDALH